MVNFSATEENYIKAIFHLQGEKEVINTNELAASLKTSAASVTDMLKKLKKKEIVDYKAYYGCKLTDRGRSIALHIIRRHRLWEYFLSQKLGFDWNEVHEVAEELEHVSSEKLIEKLDSFLGHPRFDPHGDPIPDATGKIEELQALSLADAEEHKSYLVVKVHHQSAKLLELLRQKNIAIGTTLSLKKKISFDNSVEVEIDTVLQTFSQKTAKNILVQAL